MRTSRCWGRPPPCRSASCHATQHLAPHAERVAARSRCRAIGSTALVRGDCSPSAVRRRKNRHGKNKCDASSIRGAHKAALSGNGKNPGGFRYTYGYFISLSKQGSCVGSNSYRYHSTWFKNQSYFILGIVIKINGLGVRRWGLGLVLPLECVGCGGWGCA